MTRIRGEITIAAPVTDVFDTVADERNEPRYNPRIARAEKMSPGPVGPGTRFLAEPRVPGAGEPMTVEIVGYDRPTMLATSIWSRYLTVAGTVYFSATGTDTRLRWDWDLRLRGPMRMLTPVLAVVGPRWERRNWLGLKRYLEGAAG